MGGDVGGDGSAGCRFRVFQQRGGRAGSAGSAVTNGFAVGVRIASATDITEVLCVAARDDATAQTYANTMTSTIATGI